MSKQFSAADWQKWPKAVSTVLRTARNRLVDRGSLSPEQVATALYRGILQREPDLGGLRNRTSQLRSKAGLEQVIRNFIDSPEFRQRMLKAAVPDIDLPDLTQAMPDMYRQQTVGDVTATVYTARGDGDIARMTALIERHRYYDAFGVWSPVIDLDKEITAAIVRGLGARSCFELGCFTGPVLSLLAEAGISVAGADVSHTAFSFAYPNIREAMLFGDLLGLDIDRRFDAIVCMDVLEHISPLELGRYIEKLVSLLADDGYVYINSPMYGDDAAFGTVFHPYLEEWQTVGDGASAGLGEHDREIAIAEVAERMREADVAVLRLHRRIGRDHAQTVGVAEPVEQRRERAGPRRERSRRAAGSLGDSHTGTRHAVSSSPQQLTIRGYVGRVTLIRRRPPPDHG